MLSNFFSVKSALGHFHSFLKSLLKSLLKTLLKLGVCTLLCSTHEQWCIPVTTRHVSKDFNMTGY
jgi:hypothetical protein